MSTNNLFVPVTPDITELKTGTPVIKYGGRYIVAGIGGDFIPSGIGAKPRGEWDSTTQYKERDAVTYQGQLYIALNATVGVAPNESADWLCYVQRGPAGDPLEANYIDVTEVTDGYLVLSNDTIPVSVEVDGKVFNVEDVVAEGDTFKIPVDPILANANIEYSDVLTWRVWRAGGKEGPIGPQGPPGAVSFEELTEEQKESLKGDKGEKGETGDPAPHTRVQYSLDGVTWSDSPGTDRESQYIRFSTDNGATWGDRIKFVGRDGIDAQPLLIEYSVDGINWYGNPENASPTNFIRFSTDGGGTWTKSMKLKGDKGEQGNPGYTPVRDTDYWTEADKAEIKAYVDEAILNGEW